MKNIGKSLYHFGLFLLVACLTVGVLSKVWGHIFFANILLDRQIVVGFHLFIAHGQIIVFALVTFLLAIFFRGETNASQSTQTLFWIYAVGVVLTLSLGLYKGFALSALVGMNPRIGLFQAEGVLFGGNTTLRTLTNSFSYVLMAIGLVGLFIKAKKSFFNKSS